MQTTTSPHLLLKVFTPDKWLLINQLSTGEVVMAYQGRWCSFLYRILDEENETPYLKLAIGLVNSFLHHGQFYNGQHVQLYHRGQHIAAAQVEDVPGACLHYWDNLPFDPSQKHLFPEHEVNPVLSDWVATLSGSTTKLAIETTATTEHRLVIKDAAHRTLLLAQAQQICETLKSSSMSCCYKITYTPPVYGLLELFLKEFTLAFILYNQTHFAKGIITVN